MRIDSIRSSRNIAVPDVIPDTADPRPSLLKPSDQPEVRTTTSIEQAPAMRRPSIPGPPEEKTQTSQKRRFEMSANRFKQMVVNASPQKRARTQVIGTESSRNTPDIASSRYPQPNFTAPIPAFSKSTTPAPSQFPTTSNESQPKTGSTSAAPNASTNATNTTSTDASSSTMGNRDARDFLWRNAGKSHTQALPSIRLSSHFTSGSSNNPSPPAAVSTAWNSTSQAKPRAFTSVVSEAPRSRSRSPTLTVPPRAASETPNNLQNSANSAAPTSNRSSDTPRYSDTAPVAPNSEPKLHPHRGLYGDLSFRRKNNFSTNYHEYRTQPRSSAFPTSPAHSNVSNGPSEPAQAVPTHSITPPSQPYGTSRTQMGQPRKNETQFENPEVKNILSRMAAYSREMESLYPSNTDKKQGPHTSSSRNEEQAQDITRNNNEAPEKTGAADRAYNTYRNTTSSLPSVDLSDAESAGGRQHPAKLTAMTSRLMSESSEGGLEPSPKIIDIAGTGKSTFRRPQIGVHTDSNTWKLNAGMNKPIPSVALNSGQHRTRSNFERLNIPKVPVPPAPSSASVPSTSASSSATVPSATVPSASASASGPACSITPDSHSASLHSKLATANIPSAPQKYTTPAVGRRAVSVSTTPQRPGADRRQAQWSELQWRHFSGAMRDSMEYAKLSSDQLIRFFHALREHLPADMHEMPVEEVIKRLDVWVKNTCSKAASEERS